ncbi:hypothetical protein [Trichococcus ilyis]|uniref:Uncharacterized protein n=1 Tax=Trichococcus ilyis TaxID=640938 RepID=A0A143Z662_9LACT|nr:hypothetical protein [Trichococcus ilyis]CZR06998.1 Hypothetical protein TR210_2385 [Trichococcus ilyis]SEJ90832.1 hypothetical protein SAMN05216375_13717 [Trichococcus ilyis]
MNTNKYNLFAYILACTSLIGAVQYPSVPLIWWFVIGLGSALLFIHSSKATEKKLVSLGIDVFNLVVLAILVNTLPSHIGLLLNAIVLLIVILLLFAKSKIETSIETRNTQNQG